MRNAIVCTLFIFLVSGLPGFMQGAFAGSGRGRDLEIEPMDTETTDTGSEWEHCSTGSLNCYERPLRQLEAGPFWANRGKREPLYRRDRLFVDEPHWVLGRRGGGSTTYGSDDDLNYLYGYDPFYSARGKKQKERRIHPGNVRDRRDPGGAEESPFFAARGKKGDNSLGAE